MVVKTYDQILQQKIKEFNTKAKKLPKETLVQVVGSHRNNSDKLSLNELRTAYSQILFEKYTDSEQSSIDYNRSEGNIIKPTSYQKSPRKRPAKKATTKRSKSKSKKATKKRSKSPKKRSKSKKSTKKRSKSSKKTSKKRSKSKSTKRRSKK